MTDLAIQLEGVGKTYPFFSLEDIDLTVPTGTIVGLLGANGAGKSTTLRILLELVQQDRGTVRIHGLDMAKQQVIAKQQMGFVSEDIQLYKSATLAWHMEFVRSMAGSWDKAYAEQLLQSFDLHPDRKISSLSRGGRVKATLLLALARRPRLLVLDEPTAGLDPIARHEVLRALAEVLAEEDRSVLFSSQNTLDIEQISDQITLIDRGRILESTDKESLLESWRTLRVRVPPRVSLPSLPGVTRDGGSDRVVQLRSHPFEYEHVEALQTAGATVETVERMNLEEIFVAAVLREREGTHL